MRICLYYSYSIYNVHAVTRLRSKYRQPYLESGLESDVESDVESGLAAISTSKCDLVTAFITSPEHFTH